MKKLMTVLTALAIITFFSSPAMAMEASGMAGLDIAGNSSVGVMGYIGLSNTIAHTNNCFSGSRSQTKQAFIGAGITTSAAGMICLSGSGYTMGGISGDGTFASNASGTLMGVDFGTSSVVNVSGGSGYNMPQ